MSTFTAVRFCSGARLSGATVTGETGCCCADWAAAGVVRVATTEASDTAINRYATPDAKGNRPEGVKGARSLGRIDRKMRLQ
jgi:hypothetical protein